MGRVYTSGDQFSTDMIKDLFLKMYPVGSIYLSVNSTNPASLFGGTWERIKDTFLLAAGDTYAAGATGGSATKNLQHLHSTGGHTLTIAEIPSHSHQFRIMNSSGSIGQQWQTPDNVNQKSFWDSAGSQIAYTGGGGSHNHGNTGNGLSTAQDIMPPYLAVYVWKRTA